ncbi:uncharacterized protein DSM5745_04457 [Aspergillus mulundensis]|uniref:LysM domain-containing protein n=1 Tax=Aspergillus mulundensis TaxID=1810919 RepID=A0A3D8SD96_9EURO|nr:hypothetical protein DSM5745_04457 [Aspergillus mulundensis]RDW84131.1 hypothetical protein DSM5745_04457 [Aspergillus mulundensis]
MAVVSWVLPLLPGLALAQVFLADHNGDNTSDSLPVSIEIPDTLSAACAEPLKQNVQCNASLAAITSDGYFPSAEDLAFVCTTECLSSLQSLRNDQLSACSSNDAVQTSGYAYPPTYILDQLIFTYDYTCLRDDSGAFCAPQIDSWLNAPEGMTSEQSCSSCFLRTLQTHLNSAFGYDEDTENEFVSLTESCGETNYPFTSPPAYTVDIPTSGTATSSAAMATPTVDCVDEYVIQQGDTCTSISVAKNVSTHELLYVNNLPAYCINFPTAGDSLCIPKSCEIYTVQEDDNCYSIVEAHEYAFTVTQLISWNANINRGCSNLNQLVSSQICISSPDGGVPVPDGPATTTAAAIPTDVAAGTNTQCAKYYRVSPGEDCSRITVMMGISLADFYFLNPEVNSTTCANLMAGYSYCVQAVGNINTYSGYGGATSSDGCRMTRASLPESCLATSVMTDTEIWHFPKPTTANGSTSSTAASFTYPWPITVTSTPLPLAPGTHDNCDKYTEHMNSSTQAKTDSMNTCNFIAWFSGVPLDDLLSWNPSLTYDDSNPTACLLQPGYRYCVHPAGSLTRTTSGSSSSEPTTSKTATVTSTSTPSHNATPSPVQTGMTPACTDFYYVQTGDGCYDIAASKGIALDDFYAWNPAVGTDCGGLQADVYVCVGVSPSTPSPTITTPSSITASAPSTGTGAVKTPSPVQDGMATSCTSFYEVQPGDGCYDLAASEGVALDDFYAWNPAVKNDCSGLQANVYVCVGAEGSITATMPTTTASTTSGWNAVSTPSPVQDGMTSSCGTFYDVQAGDGCWDIANRYGVALADFYSWNPAVGDNCGGLQAGVYVCVGLVG